MNLTTVSARIGATSIRILGLLLSSYNETLSNAILNANLLQLFIELIDFEKAVIRKEVIWSLSNILARSPERIQLCLDNGLVLKLINKMAVDPDLKVRNEAIWAMSNAFYKGTAQQASIMVNQYNFFVACKETLTIIKDLKNIFVVLEAI